MLRDFDSKKIDNFVLWSGDSDFVDPILHLKQNGKNVYLFATTRKVPRELNEAKIPIFDIKKIKEFICFVGELPQSIIDRIDAKT